MLEGIPSLVQIDFGFINGRLQNTLTFTAAVLTHKVQYTLKFSADQGQITGRGHNLCYSVGV